jgi:oligopeptide/dipeptide ABC transporter ATP-binding protein
MSLLRVRNLEVHYVPRRRRPCRGRRRSRVPPGSILGLVGESSCAIHFGHALTGVLPDTARIAGGGIGFEGRDLIPLSAAERGAYAGAAWRSFRNRDERARPGAAPAHANARSPARARRAFHRHGTDRAAALRRVEIAAPEQRIAQYPHQMSGGMKQRVVGAIAITGEPGVLIADEPTTALDVTIQLQYLKLLKRLQAETGMAILFITHDFGVVGRMCDRVAVMYAGRIVECGPVRQIFEAPQHPYTRALIASVPKMSGPIGRLTTIEGQPPSLMDLPVGCRFASRCALVEQRCLDAYPGTVRVGEEHTADCWKVVPQ